MVFKSSILYKDLNKHVIKSLDSKREWNKTDFIEKSIDLHNFDMSMFLGHFYRKKIIFYIQKREEKQLNNLCN